MSQGAEIFDRIAKLPAPPSFLPTSKVAPLPEYTPELKNAILQPLHAAAPQAIARRYETMRRAFGVELGLLASLALLLMFVEVGFGTLGQGLPGIAILFIGLLPLPFMIGFGLWLDRYEPEPPWLLARALLWGAGASVLMAGIFNTIIGAILGPWVAVVIGAPFVEEFLKGMAIWWVFRRRSEHLHGVKDAITYALFVGMGFAVVETITYYAQGLEAGDNEALVLTIVARGLATPFLHAFLSSFVAIGIAKYAQGSSKGTLIKWYLLAVFLHGLWNSGVGIVLYPVVYLPLFVWGLLKLKRHRQAEEGVLVAGVGSEINTGVIGSRHFEAIQSKTSLWDFLKGLGSSSHEIHTRRGMQAAAWSLATHRQAVIDRQIRGLWPQALDRSVDDYLRLLLQIRAQEWSLINAKPL